MEDLTKIDFGDISVDESWCFKNVRSTEQWTHGYHRYPAKFLPNVVKKLIEVYAADDDVVADIFAGCGTTLVEAKVHGKHSIGIDINPVAKLITEVKTHALNPNRLLLEYNKLVGKFDNFDENIFLEVEVHERLDYWFREKEKNKIIFLYKEILKIGDVNFKKFFLVCLSNILKNCSMWLQSSTKPQLDKSKEPDDPFDVFQKHCKKMIKQNKSYYNELIENNFLDISCEIRLEDARNTEIEDSSVGIIITSPPYVTSYEYADIHQLTGFLFEYIDNLPEFRRDFIGTFYSNNQDTNTPTPSSQKIVDELFVKDAKNAREVANYFNDMHEVGKEMYRILKPNGHACIVIGNTTFKEVKIKSAEVFRNAFECWI